ncbi:MAG: hypothetical protein K2G55_14475 [Lachnospiraceae bacterium]|nr:hypothetical protein [Lachnospiraceae bacterium]
MRHKILLALQDMIDSDPVVLEQAAELDETFVLECYKGKELPPELDRPARKHGARAKKRAFQMSISASIQAYSVADVRLQRL